MNERTRSGFEILQVALVVGIAGDVLLRATPWGLNVLLFNILFVAGMIVLLWRSAPKYLTSHNLALFGAMIFFASMFVWRDAIELRVADTIAIIVILSVLFVPRMKVATKLAGVFHYIVAFLWSAFSAVLGPAAILTVDINWETLVEKGWSKRLLSVLRGVVIAAPFLFVFGALFVAADAVYEGLVQGVFNIVPRLVFNHILLFSLFTWLSAGYLRGVLMYGLERSKAASKDPEPTQRDPDLSPVENMREESVENTPALPDNMTILDHINRSDAPDVAEPENEEKKPWEWASLDNTFLPPALTLGTVEIGVILGLINLLFLSFVLVQLPYLFGGMELVQNTPDFKLADYARRGFGELVAVSALVLPMLLVGHWLVRKDEPLAGKLFRVFAGVQLVLLFVIMASATQRLLLLTGNLGYGLTTVRLYPMIFMSFLALVFVWFALTVLRGARQYFAWGALWLAFAVLGATHVLNPDEFIVKTNLALMREGRAFDAGYNAGLSQDAVPVLLGSLSELSLKDQCITRHVLWGGLSSRNEQDENDLRSWNWSRWKAAPWLIDNTRLIRDMSSVTNPQQCSEIFSNR